MTDRSPTTSAISRPEPMPGIMDDPPTAPPAARVLRLAPPRPFAPQPIRVTPDDLLTVWVRNALANVQLTLGGRFWRLDGTTADLGLVITPTSDRALNTVTQRLGDGFLAGLALTATSGAPTRGQTFAALALTRPPAGTGAARQGLAKGYITTMGGVFWPGGRTQDGIEGPGALYRIVVATPAPGADFTQTVPTGARWLVHGVRATLATSSTVATRLPLLVIDDGANIIILVPEAQSVSNNSTAEFCWATAFTATAFSGTNNTSPMPFPYPMLGGWRLRGLTTALQAADQWSGITYYVEEWLED